MKLRSLRMVASFVIFTFTLTSLNPVSFASTPEVSSLPFKTLEIPAEFGQVTDIFQGASGAPAFIHIQSAHGNYQAEKNIENILGHIEQNSSVKLMLLEGASEKIQPGLFRMFPKHPDFNQKVTDKLVAEGYLTGPENYLINLPSATRNGQRATEGKSTLSVERSSLSAMQAFGIEDLEAYKKDREAFIKVVKSEKDAQTYLMKLRADIDKKYASKLSKELLSLVRQEETLASGTLSFEAWLKTLGEASKRALQRDLTDALYQGEYPYLVRYYKLQTIASKIDREKALSEMSDFLKELEKRKISREIIELFKQSAWIVDGGSWIGKNGNVVPSTNHQSPFTVEGYSSLRLAFDRAFSKLPKDFTLKAWPAWALYAQYTILSQELSASPMARTDPSSGGESKGLHEETLKLKDQILTALAQTPAEKEYLAAARQLYLLRRLFALELTRSEYEELVRSTEYGVRRNAKTQGDAVRRTPSAFPGLYQTAMDFYSTAIIRENHMFSNALSKMSAEKQERAVIVTGGFHTEGLKKLAQERNFSYLQITPRINEVTPRDHEIYLKSVLGTRDFETSQMSRPLVGVTDFAGVVGQAQAAQVRSEIRELTEGAISREAVPAQPTLRAELAQSAFGKTPATVRSETRTDFEEMRKEVAPFKEPLHLDDTDIEYFLTMLYRHRAAKEGGQVAQKKIGVTFWPSAMLDEGQVKDHLNQVEYRDLLAHVAALKDKPRIDVRFNSMDGGLGTTVDRFRSNLLGALEDADLDPAQDFRIELVQSKKNVVVKTAELKAKGEPRTLLGAILAEIDAHQKDPTPFDKESRIDIYFFDAASREPLKKVFVTIGAKGTDLPFDITVNGKQMKVTVAEIKAHRLYQSKGAYRFASFRPLVNDDSRPSYEAFLDLPYFQDVAYGVEKPRTYRQLLSEDNLSAAEPHEFFMQKKLPNIRQVDGVGKYDGEKIGDLTSERTAPANHGQLGFHLVVTDILNRADQIIAESERDHVTKLEVFQNGDNASSTINPEIAQYVAAENIPMAIVTTDKAPVDRKGGQIGLEAKVNPDGSLEGVTINSDGTLTIAPGAPVKVTILEKAEAQASGDLHKFFDMGIGGESDLPGRKQSFNTNVIIFNATLLAKLLKGLEQVLGRTELLKQLSPDNISESKKNGAGQPFYQLGGAISSLVFNLNAIFTLADKNTEAGRAILKVYEENAAQAEAAAAKSILKLINLSTNDRSEFFAPIKEATDYALLRYMDFYEYDNRGWLDIKAAAKTGDWELPRFTLGEEDATGEKTPEGKKTEAFYKDTLNAKDAFLGVTPVNLDIEVVRGKVLIPGARLEGKIVVTSDFPGIFNISGSKDPVLTAYRHNGRLELANVSIFISKEGKVDVQARSEAREGQARVNVLGLMAAVMLGVPALGGTIATNAPVAEAPAITQGAAVLNVEVREVRFGEVTRKSPAKTAAMSSAVNAPVALTTNAPNAKITVTDYAVSADGTAMVVFVVEALKNVNVADLYVSTLDAVGGPVTGRTENLVASGGYELNEGDSLPLYVVIVLPSGKATGFMRPAGDIDSRSEARSSLSPEDDGKAVAARLESGLISQTEAMGLVASRSRAGKTTIGSILLILFGMGISSLWFLASRSSEKGQSQREIRQTPARASAVTANVGMGSSSQREAIGIAPEFRHLPIFYPEGWEQKVRLVGDYKKILDYGGLSLIPVQAEQAVSAQGAHVGPSFAFWLTNETDQNTAIRKVTYYTYGDSNVPTAGFEVLPPQGKILIDLPSGTGHVLPLWPDEDKIPNQVSVLVERASGREVVFSFVGLRDMMKAKWDLRKNWTHPSDTINSIIAGQGRVVHARRYDFGGQVIDIGHGSEIFIGPGKVEEVFYDLGDGKNWYEIRSMAQTPQVLAIVRPLGTTSQNPEGFSRPRSEARTSQEELSAKFPTAEQLDAKRPASWQFWTTDPVVQLMKTFAVEYLASYGFRSANNGWLKKTMADFLARRDHSFTAFQRLLAEDHFEKLVHVGYLKRLPANQRPGAVKAAPAAPAKKSSRSEVRNVKALAEALTRDWETVWPETFRNVSLDDAADYALAEGNTSLGIWQKNFKQGWPVRQARTFREAMQQTQTDEGRKLMLCAAALVSLGKNRTPGYFFLFRRALQDPKAGLDAKLQDLLAFALQRIGEDETIRGIMHEMGSAVRVLSQGADGRPAAFARSEVREFVMLAEQARENGWISEAALQNIRSWSGEEYARVHEPLAAEFRAAGQDPKAWSKINDAWYTKVAVGTAGMRGTLGLGTNRISEYTIGSLMLAHALSVNDPVYTKIIEENYPEFRAKKLNRAVVIGGDSRYGSYDTKTKKPGKHIKLEALINAALGIKAYVYKSPVSTPQLAWSVHELDVESTDLLVSGSMNTASHNPRTDNGNKPYKIDGSQSTGVFSDLMKKHVPNAGVAALNALTYDGLNVLENLDEAFELALANGDIRWVGGAEDDSYAGDAYHADELFVQRELQEAIHAINGVFDNAQLDLKNAKIVISPLYGVSRHILKKIVKARGLNDEQVIWVEDEPDSDFPGVEGGKPNPEEPKARLAALRKAVEVNADLVLWTDPDADRPAVATKKDLKTKAVSVDDYVSFNGNQQLAILMDYLVRELKTLAAQESLADDATRTHLARRAALIMANIGKTFAAFSIVSGDLAKIIARSAGMDVVETMVGFKYIGDQIELRSKTIQKLAGITETEWQGLSNLQKLELALQNSQAFIFGGEESLGALSSDGPHDKDALSGVMWFVEIMGRLRKDGKTLQDRLNEIYQTYGYFSERFPMLEKSKKYAGVEVSEADAMSIIKAETGPSIMGYFRSTPPKTIGGKKVIAVLDYGAQVAKDTDGNVLFDADSHSGFITAETPGLPESFRKALGKIGMYSFRHKTVPGSASAGEKLPKEAFVRFILEDGSIVTPRPSGTEPKLKFYILGRGSYENKAAVDAWVEAAAKELDAIGDAIAKQRFPEKFAPVAPADDATMARVRSEVRDVLVAEGVIKPGETASAPVLVFNAGSSTIKWQVIDMVTGKMIAKGKVDIGTGEGKAANYDEALARILKELADRSLDPVAVGHRVVHGGEAFKEPALVNASVIAAIEKVSGLAPLHNPPNLMGIRAAQKAFPAVPHVAVFDTAFHQTMPSTSYLYSIPRKYYEAYQVRKYGFHGTSHRFVMEEFAKSRGKKPEDVSVVTVHLGNGASVAGIKNGRSIKTSMGLTPVEGVTMGTRSGDIDAGAVLYIMEKEGLTPAQMGNVLNKESGLKGLAGISDVMDLSKLADEGNADAIEALEIFIDRVLEKVFAYAGFMDHLDAIILTGGVGENSNNYIQPRLLARLNQSFQKYAATERPWIGPIKTNEELVIARDTMKVLSEAGLVSWAAQAVVVVADAATSPVRSESREDMEAKRLALMAEAQKSFAQAKADAASGDPERERYAPLIQGNGERKLRQAAALEAEMDADVRSPEPNVVHRRSEARFQDKEAERLALMAEARKLFAQAKADAKSGDPERERYAPLIQGNGERKLQQAAALEAEAHAGVRSKERSELRTKSGEATVRAEAPWEDNRPPSVALQHGTDRLKVATAQLAMTRGAGSTEKTKSRSEVRAVVVAGDASMFMPQLFEPETLSEILGNLGISIPGLVKTAQEAAGGVVAVAVVKAAAAKKYAQALFALVTGRSAGTLSEASVADIRKKAQMFLGIRQETLTASDVFVLGSDLFLHDHLAAAGIRQAYPQTTITAIVRNASERALVERLNLLLMKEDLLPVLPVDAQDPAELAEHLKQVRKTHGAVRPMALLYGSEIIPDALKQQIPNQMTVTQRMLNGFVNAIGSLMKKLESDLAATFAMAKSA